MDALNCPTSDAARSAASPGAAGHPIGAQAVAAAVPVAGGGGPEYARQVGPVRGDVLGRVIAYLEPDPRLMMGNGRMYSVIPKQIRQSDGARSVTIEFELDERHPAPMAIQEALRRGAEPPRPSGAVEGGLEGFPTPVFAYTFENGRNPELTAFATFAKSMHASVEVAMGRLADLRAARKHRPAMVTLAD